MTYKFLTEKRFIFASLCQGECVNTDGSFTCYCEPGWDLDQNCRGDLDECADDPMVCGPPWYKCTNTEGAYGCDCVPTADYPDYCNY